MDKKKNIAFLYFFPLTVGPIEKGDQNEHGRVTSSENVPIHPNAYAINKGSTVESVHICHSHTAHMDRICRNEIKTLNHRRHLCMSRVLTKRAHTVT